MGVITKTKQIFSTGMKYLSAGAKAVCETVEKGAVLLGWNETAEKCREGINACEASRVKWKDREDRYKAENKFGKSEKPKSYRPDKKQREDENKCIALLEERLQGNKLIDVLRTQNPAQRLGFIEQIANDAANALNIKIQPIEYYIGGDTSFGYYSRVDNKIYLNEAYVTCDNVYFVKEQIFTVFHESMHAAQLQAIEDLARGGSGHGYSVERLLEWATNFDHYIRPEVDLEAYRNQPLERDAFGLEWRMKDFF